MVPGSKVEGMSLTSPEHFPAETTAVAEERRDSDRMSRRIAIKARGEGCAQAHSCVTADISESGVNVRMPTDVGLAVGQRIELIFGDDLQSPKPPNVEGQAYFATIVRTQLLIENSKPILGAGLRFDRPLYL